MARRVLFHVGLPKTGTTYLQSMMWANRDELARQGVLLPGTSGREHLWASGVVRGDPRIDRRGPDAAGAWDRLVAEMAAWPGTAVVSHEFFSSATAARAQRAVAAVGGPDEPAEVHVVLTARDTLSLVTARWQEFVKNGSTVPVDRYPVREGTTSHDDWDWGSLDLADVLERWGSAVPHERVHVLTLPKPGEPRETLWLRFAELVGIDPTTCADTEATPNESLGVVEVELLRRINADLDGFSTAIDRGNWIRGYLAQGKLVPRRGDRFWPSAERAAELCERGNRVVDAVQAGGYDVVGDVADLRPPAELPTRRHPDDVSDAEMLAASTAVIAAMLTDVRRLTRHKRTLEQELEQWRSEPLPDLARRTARRTARETLRATVGRLRRVGHRT